jgi:hypothetical protein
MLCDNLEENMKKLIALILALAMMLSLAACSSKKQEDPAVNNEVSQPQGDEVIDNENIGKLKREFFSNIKDGEGMRLALSLARVPTVNGIGRGVEICLPIAKDVVGLGMRNGANYSSCRAVALNDISHSIASIGDDICHKALPVVIFKSHLIGCEGENFGAVFKEARLEATVHKFLVIGTDVGSQMRKCVEKGGVVDLGSRVDRRVIVVKD